MIDNYRGARYGFDRLNYYPKNLNKNKKNVT